MQNVHLPSLAIFSLDAFSAFAFPSATHGYKERWRESVSIVEMCMKLLLLHKKWINCLLFALFPLNTFAALPEANAIK